MVIAIAAIKGFKIMLSPVQMPASPGETCGPQSELVQAAAGIVLSMAMLVVCGCRDVLIWGLPSIALPPRRSGA
jgi:hypothetical protein